MALDEDMHDRVAALEHGMNEIIELLGLLNRRLGHLDTESSSEHAEQLPHDIHLRLQPGHAILN